MANRLSNLRLNSKKKKKENELKITQKSSKTATHVSAEI